MVSEESQNPTCSRYDFVLNPKSKLRSVYQKVQVKSFDKETAVRYLRLKDYNTGYLNNVSDHDLREHRVLDQNLTPFKLNEMYLQLSLGKKLREIANIINN